MTWSCAWRRPISHVIQDKTTGASARQICNLVPYHTVTITFSCCIAVSPECHGPVYSNNVCTEHVRIPATCVTNVNVKPCMPSLWYLLIPVMPPSCMIRPCRRLSSAFCEIFSGIHDPKLLSVRCPVQEQFPATAHVDVLNWVPVRKHTGLDRSPCLQTVARKAGIIYPVRA